MATVQYIWTVLNGVILKAKKQVKQVAFSKKRKVLINTTKHQSQTIFFVYYKILVVINS